MSGGEPDGGTRRSAAGGPIAEPNAEAVATTRPVPAPSAPVRASGAALIEQLAGGVAHEFNNLLAVIGGSLELIEPDLSERGARELLGEARGAVDSGAHLVRQLLSFARQHELRPVCLSVNGRIAEIARLLECTLGENIALRLRLGADVHDAFVDPSETDRALVNLAMNARDAMPTGGTLTIETRDHVPGAEDPDAARDPRPGEWVEIVFTDTGEGMPPAVLERAIDPFFTTRAPGRGSGLGLSGVHGFATQSGGALAIESEVGAGTVVRLLVPRAHPTTSGADVAAAEAGSSFPGGELVLVIEDDPSVRRLTLRQLRSLGYRTLDAASGPEAILRLEAEPSVALVFSDVVMPGGMSGHDVARWLRAHRPEVGVLLTSGYDDRPRAGDAASASDVALLGKPYALAALARAVRDALARRGAPARDGAAS